MFAMCLDAPGRFINFGDALEYQPISVGVSHRLAERTGVDALRGLFADPREALKFYDIAKLPVIYRHVAWWDASQPVPAFEQRDYALAESGVVKFTGQTAGGKPVLLATKAGHNDGHHSHTDVATFILAVDGDSLIPDSGRGHYSKDYFRQGRYANAFNNSYTHNVPRIGGQLQAPGPEFGGHQQYHGALVEHGQRDGLKVAVVEFHDAYDLPALTGARRTLALDAASGAVTLRDDFAFAGNPLAIEEAFVSWLPVRADGSRARITGPHAALDLAIVEPEGAVFAVESLEEDCRANDFDETLHRLAVTLPEGATHFVLRLTPA